MKTIILLLATFLSTQAFAFDCKDSVIPNIKANDKNEEVVSYLKALESTVLFSDEKTTGSYCHLHNWYEDRMSSRRFGSRMLAILIIILGASLPLITILDNIFTNQKFWAAFVGATIVISQGFAQTFQYEETWRSYTVGKLELESAHRTWQKKIIDSSVKSSGLNSAQEATDEFSNAVSKIVIKETTGFFDSLTKVAENET